MSYQVLARKWRPRRFADLVGQEHVARALINALDHDRLHHAFLFTGTRGVGKTTIARILAKSLNCETGVSSQPCGVCTSCKEVDEGRFLDLIEVDAASRTKVDDTRELLDNVQYAPTRGRYKVYLIDEVHMLSGHSFNALLKTLEEPPPHVKFLLATTDPQKLPVTVLSRCLQFHLMRLTPELIEGQLKKILETETIPFEAGALPLLARAADGSMRDALSLLDQAIAFGGGSVGEQAVREMLGTIDAGIVEHILEALADDNAEALLKAAAEAHARNADADGLLAELLRALHRLALLQTLPATASEEGDALFRELAQRLSPEDVQLYYQIALMGRNDLNLAPDPRTGLEMALLRMLAFRPAAPEGRGKPGNTPDNAVRERVAAASRAAVPERAVPPVVAATPAAQPATAESWSALVTSMNLTGLTRELAQNCALQTREGQAWKLLLDPACAHLLNREREAALREAASKTLGQPVTLQIAVGKPEAETPARERQRVQQEKLQAAAEAIENDPAVKALQAEFGARINAASIRPK
jgi:DNA polymerase-3 subunit gamma/tau